MPVIIPIIGIMTKRQGQACEVTCYFLATVNVIIYITCEKIMIGYQNVYHCIISTQLTNSFCGVLNDR